MLAVISGAFGALALAWSAAPVHSWTAVAFLALLACATENFSLQLPLLGSVSLSFGVAYAAVLYAGPVGAAIVVMASSWNLQDLRSRRSWLEVGYNAAQLVVSALISGFVFLNAGGAPLGRLGQTGHLSLLSCAVAAVAFYLINVSLVCAYFALAKNLSVRRVLEQQRFGSDIPSMFVLALLGLVLAETLDTAGPIAVLLVAAPFVVARQTIRAYEELKAAYVDTVRCLVSTIEAKDEYTRGHSDRVAHYAALACEELQLSAPVVERVEFAALLHDVGKIDIDSDTLRKNGPLTSAEYAEIKKHPASGARILSGIELLSDIVPIVRAHHERIDGAGYPDGLSGIEIPFESRILAVADCYDAMTSDRPYRHALSERAATAELMVSAGSQLDERVVRAFLARLAATER